MTTLKIKFTSVIIFVATAIAIAAPVLNSRAVYADCGAITGGLQEGANCGQDSSGERPGNLNDVIGTVINTILFVVGILSVIMLIYGGIKYSMSAGDTAKVTSAKNTVMYAIVGLIISILAYAIVNWVIGVFQN